MFGKTTFKEETPEDRAKIVVLQRIRSRHRETIAKILLEEGVPENVVRTFGTQGFCDGVVGEIAEWVLLYSPTARAEFEREVKGRTS